MRMPSPKLRRSLEKATARYATLLPAAVGYLADRGIDEATARTWRLGVVCSDAEPGHEPAAGRLSIPYTNKLGVIGLKFRCLADHDCKEAKCPKYLAPLGQEPYLYNVAAVDEEADTIHITEGELDAIVLATVLGQPVVGLPGANAWRPHHPWHFRGFARVLVWADGDKAGQDLARMLRKELSAAEIVTMPQGQDVTDVFVQLGAEGIIKLAGEDDE